MQQQRTHTRPAHEPLSSLYPAWLRPGLLTSMMHASPRRMAQHDDSQRDLNGNTHLTDQPGDYGSKSVPGGVGEGLYTQQPEQRLLACSSAAQCPACTAVQPMVPHTSNTYATEGRHQSLLRHHAQPCPCHALPKGKACMTACTAQHSCCILHSH